MVCEILFAKLLIPSLFCGILLCIGCCNQVVGKDSMSAEASAASKPADKLAVLWTSDDPQVAHMVCFMYTHNAKKQAWFDTVQLIIWGPSSKLLAEDIQLQNAVKAMIADGVEVKACQACADSYNVSEKLSSLGVEVIYMGIPLTEILKADDWKVLTF